MVTEGSNGGASPEPDLPEEAAYLGFRRESDFISCARVLLTMTAYIPLTGDGQFLVTTRGGLRYLRTYTSRARLTAGGYDADQLLERGFAELLQRWNNDEIGVVVNPEDVSEFRLPSPTISEVLALPPTGQADAEPTPVVPVTPPKQVGGFRFAAMVDGFNEAGAPILAPERGRVEDPGERQLLRRYLDAGSAIRVVTGQVSDLFEPERGLVVPAHTLTDGRWIWPAAVSYYLDTYGIAPEPEFLDTIRKARYACPPVPEDLLREAAAALQERDRIASGMVAQWRDTQ